MLNLNDGVANPLEMSSRATSLASLSAARGGAHGPSAGLDPGTHPSPQRRRDQTMEKL